MLSQSYVYSSRRSDTYCPCETKIPEKTWQQNIYNFLQGFFLEFTAISQSRTERWAWGIVWRNSCLSVGWKKKKRRSPVPWVLFGWEEHGLEWDYVLLYTTAVREKWLQQFALWAILSLQHNHGKNEPSVTPFTSEVHHTPTHTSDQFLQMWLSLLLFSQWEMRVAHTESLSPHFSTHACHVYKSNESGNALPRL